RLPRAMALGSSRRARRLRAVAAPPRRGLDARARQPGPLTAVAPITPLRHDSRYLDAVLRRKRLLTAPVHGTGLYRLVDAVWVANRRVEVTRHRVTAPLA